MNWAGVGASGLNYVLTSAALTLPERAQPDNRANAHATPIKANRVGNPIMVSRSVSAGVSRWSDMV
jgi:hypothetical protein